MTKNLLIQVKYEMNMFFREPMYVFFSLLLPAASFAMFAAMYGNQTYGGLDYFSAYIPGFVVIIMFTSCIFSVGFQNVMNRELGVYKRLMATPINLRMVLFASLIRGFIVAVFGLIEILVISRLGFGKNLTNYWGQFLLCYLVITLVSLMIGFSVGIFFKKTKTALMALMAAMYPVMFLSDATIPLSVMPQIVQKAAPIVNPLYHMNIILRLAWTGKIFKINNEMFIAVVYLIVVSIVLMFASLKVYRREEKL